MAALAARKKIVAVAVACPAVALLANEDRAAAALIIIVDLALVGVVAEALALVALALGMKRVFAVRAEELLAAPAEGPLAAVALPLKVLVEVGDAR